MQEFATRLHGVALSGNERNEGKLLSDQMSEGASSRCMVDLTR